MSSPATTKLKCNEPIGTRPSLEFRRVHELKVDSGYQRSIDSGPSQTLIRKIAMFWDWSLCQPLIVARRHDGSFVVVDGQHRLAAARLRRDIYDLPCVVSPFESVGDEAAAFVAINQQRRPLNRMQIYRAALAAGDVEAQQIERALDYAGLRVGTSFDLSCQKPGAITCLRGLEECLRSFGAPALQASLKVLADSFKDEVLRYSGTMFPGIAAIVGDEMKKPRAKEAPRFPLMVSMIKGQPQAAWYAEISAKTAEIPTRKFAAIAVFRTAWSDCLEAFEGEES